MFVIKPPNLWYFCHRILTELRHLSEVDIISEYLNVAIINYTCTILSY